MKPHLLVLALLGSLACHQPLEAAGLSVPKWLDFRKKESTKNVVHKKGGKQMLDGRPVKRTTTTKPSMLSTVTNGPKRLMAGTKSMFSSSKSTPEKSPKKLKYSTSRKKQKQKADDEKNASLWKRWFAPDEPKPPASIGEWMALPRNDL